MNWPSMLRCKSIHTATRRDLKGRFNRITFRCKYFFLHNGGHGGIVPVIYKGEKKAYGAVWNDKE